MSYKNQKPQRLRVSQHEGTGQTLSLIKIQSRETSEALRGSISELWLLPTCPWEEELPSCGYRM